MTPADDGIRTGRGDDLPGIVDLMNHYVLETPITFDVDRWTTESRRTWIEQFDTRGPYRLWVAERDGRIDGYAATLRYRAKAAYRTTVETSIYLRPEAAGAGLGARLYEALFQSIQDEDVHLALAGVTLPNPASIALHTRFGFRSTGVLHEVGRKFDRYWDVEWFEKRLSPSD